MNRLRVIHDKDNVGTAIRSIKSGETVPLEIGGEHRELRVRDEIPLGHKVALMPMEAGREILKYGEVIGVADSYIQEGQLVHLHNVRNLRGRADDTQAER